MFHENFETNDELVDYLKRTEKIKSDKVEEAFRNTDREKFVQQGSSYQDASQPLDEEATISAPHMVAINTELLELQKENHVLEIGSGSGYQIAIIAEIAEKVVGVERIEKLVNQSRKNLKKYENVDIKHGDGLKEIDNKYERILYSCSINKKEFNNAKKYLKKEGILVAPIKKDEFQEIVKYKNGKEETKTRVRFVDKKEGKK